MHVLLFRHVPFEHAGLIAPALAGRGIDCRYVDLARNPDQPFDSDAASGLIFMGGPMSANDELPFLRRELRLIEAAAAASKPVLGICLGAQLIARALGARVYRNPTKEIGWAPLYFTREAGSDCLLGGLDGPEQVFHWHGETFDLPEGAALLASSDLCRNQAFRMENGVYGFQFHLEVTPSMIADWCRQDANAGDLRELSGPIDPAAGAGRLKEVAELVFGRWAGLLPAGR